MERKGLKVRAHWVDEINLVEGIRDHEIRKRVKFRVYLLEDGNLDIEPLTNIQELLK
jgi:hypothetical protein